MTDGAIAAFDTTATTTRGFTGHEMIDPVGLVHMNGRVYDPEIGRFLSADPFVQETGNLQSWNRYSYVLNNPLSFTDPSGFFFSKLFKSIGRALGSLFRAIGAAVKKILQNPIFRAIINIVGCALPGVGQLACAAITGALSAAAGGSLADSLKAAAFAFVSMGVFKFVGGFTNALSGVGGALLKAGIHGVIGGALSVAQGGTFFQGFASSAVSALGGFAADVVTGDTLAHTLIVAGAGCAAAVVTGGKCAEAATTAAFANLYNKFGGVSALASISDELSLFEEAGGSRPLTGPGHHMITNETVRSIGTFSSAALSVFDDTVANGGGRLAVRGHNFGDGHPAYNKQLTPFVRSWLDGNNIWGSKIDPSQMTGDQAKGLIRAVNTNPELGAFNRKVYIRGVTQWFNNLPAWAKRGRD